MPELPVGSACCRWWAFCDGDAKQGSEGGVSGAAAVEAEGELVEVGLEVLLAQAVITSVKVV